MKKGKFSKAKGESVEMENGEIVQELVRLRLVNREPGTKYKIVKE